MTKNCHLICGEDDFQVGLEAHRMIDALVPPDQRTFGLEVVDGRVETLDESLQVIRRCLESMSMDGLFGGGDKLIWLREPACLSQDRIARSPSTKDLLEELTAKIKAGLPEGQHLLLTTAKINRGSALFKAFAAHGEVNDFGSNLKAKACEARAGRLLDDWLPRVGLTMKPGVRQEFLARAGTDSRQLVSELQKLACYCGSGGEARSADVQAIVSGGQFSEIWNFLDAFGMRRADELIQQLRIQLEQSENPIRLASSLETRVTELLLLREALDRKWAVPAGYAGLKWSELPPDIEAWLASQEQDIRKWNSYRLSRLVMQANVWTLRELRVARHVLIELREGLVSTNLPKEFLLEVNLIRALGRKARPRAKPA